MNPFYLLKMDRQILTVAVGSICCCQSVYYIYKILQKWTKDFQVNVLKLYLRYPVGCIEYHYVYKNLSLRQAVPLPHCTDLFLLDIFSIRTYF